jgi:integrase
LDFEKKEWRIPPENSKNGKPHTVYLSEFAANRFKALHALNEAIRDKEKANVWCFPNRENTNYVCGKTITKQVGDRQRNGRMALSGRSHHHDALILSGGRWTPHDLRRTGATMMVSLGVIPEVAERCLNHLEQNKVKRIYQRHNYEAEMREAWRLLGVRLDTLLYTGSENVVPMLRLA